MTYEEIEDLFKKHGQNSKIERLRVAVGEEATELRELATLPELSDSSLYSMETRNKMAREYYAEDITKWLNSGGSPDPEELLGRRSRYVNSWAFAQMIRGPEHEENDEEETVSVEDAVLLRICDANSRLGLAFVEMVDRWHDNQGRAEDSMAVNRIQEALDAADVPRFHKLGRRKLGVWERVESALVKLRELLLDGNTKSTDCCNCQLLRANVRKTADNMVWMAERVHQGHHTGPGGWKECDTGICGSMEQMLGEVGFDKDLNPTELMI